MRNSPGLELVLTTTLVAALVFPPSSHAAEVTSTLAGTVRDHTGSAIPGATVRAQQGDTNTTHVKVTDVQGEYRFEKLPVGRYQVTAELPGFKTLRTTVTLGAGAVSRWDVVLELAHIGETIEVTGTLAELQTESATVTASASILNGRNFAALSLLAPGVKGDALAGLRRASEKFNTEAYAPRVDNELLDVVRHPLSTFSVDVDTASYANVRRFLNDGELPPADAVRIEEMVNYFPYAYAPPDGRKPFAVHVETAPAPWNPDRRLLRVALKAREIARAARPASNLVFLVDVSGSMDEANKLPLVQQALGLIVRELDARDRVSMVVYAGAAGLVLPATPGDQTQAILGAIERLEAGGSTNGAQGIQLAYQLAADHFVRGGVNRVILATDGDFNVGVSDQGSLQRLIEEKAKSGVFLSVFGFGMGNYKDSTLELLADKGNGHYGYIDTLAEARKNLVQELTSTLVTVAKDVKIQIEFNPTRVLAYRLIGYENRLLRDEDFANDAKDAGEVGAGHAVTALYEIVPAGGEWNAPHVDALTYQAPARLRSAARSRELMRLKLRYKSPEGERSRLEERPVKDEAPALDAASADFKFAAAVAAFGMILRSSPEKGAANPEAVLALAAAGLDNDPYGYRAEFVELVKKAQPLIAERDVRVAVY